MLTTLLRPTVCYMYVLLVQLINACMAGYTVIAGNFHGVKNVLKLNIIVIIVFVSNS